MKKVYDSAIFVADYLSWDQIECARNGKFKPIEEIHEDVYSLVKKTVEYSTNEMSWMQDRGFVPHIDIHEDVEKIEEMLYTLKYLDENPDNVYSEATKKAVETIRPKDFEPFGLIFIWLF